jgi:UDP-2,3-diacylglucosamine pyrophosphatase LpxH
MDTKLIKQFGTDILCYPIRTERQKKRMQYEDFDKHLIALDKKESVLHGDCRRPEYEPLIPSVQRGWKRFFVLRDDIARGADAQFFENILKKINTQKIYWRKDFKVKKRKFGRKIYVVQTQELFKPDAYEFSKFKFTEKERTFFDAEFSYDKWHGKFIKRYVFNEPWRFVLRIRPNMIDKQKKIDAEKEARLKEIGNYIRGNNFDKRLHRMIYGHYQHKTWGMPAKGNPFKNKSFGDIIDLVKEENI